MTKDEVMALSDEELRIRAGVLSGWHFHVVREIDGRPQSRGWNRSSTDTDPETFVDLPDFVKDIAAAWELADSLPQLVITRLIGRWKVEWFNGMGGNEIEDESVSRALTRAFVLAMTGDKGD